MKSLYLVRHSKALRDDANVKDVNRPLVEKGIERAAKMAGIFLQKHNVPELIISSHALRAKETASILADHFNYLPGNIQYDPLIYRCHYSYLVETVHLLGDEMNSVMIIGHNPAITYAASHFLKEDLEYMRTCAIVCIRFASDSWDTIHLPETYEIIE